MKLPRIHLSERTQVVLILFAAVSALLATWFFLLLPQSRSKAANEAMRLKLSTSPYAKISIPSLIKTADDCTNQVSILQREWKQTANRLATFANQAALRRKTYDRIDFKVELFNTRDRLLEKSEKLGIPLIPADLGIDDAITSGDREKIRERMLQLKAVEKLVDLTFDRRIERLIAINPLPRKIHNAKDGGILFDEYPVRVEFDVSFDNLYALFQSVFEENSVFVFRSIRIASGTRPNDPVRVQAVMSALVFE